LVPVTKQLHCYVDKAVAAKLKSEWVKNELSRTVRRSAITHTNIQQY